MRSRELLTSYSHENLSARVASPSGLNSAEVAAWETLSTTVKAVASPFFTIHYVRAVAEAGMDVNVCVIYEGDRVRAFLPYQHRSRLCRFLKVAEPVGGEMTDYFGLIAEPGFVISPKTLLSLSNLNYLGFTHLDETQFGYGLTGEQPRIGLRSDIGSNAEQFLEEISVRQKKYISDATRLERKLQEEVGPIRLELEAASGSQMGIKHLINEKRAQYARTDMPDSLADDWKQTLLEILSETRFPNCKGILSTLYAGDIWLASHFGLLGNQIFQYWFPVYNPSFAKYAPGRLLNLSLIKESSKLGFTVFDRGEGYSDDKKKLANGEHLYYRGAWHNNSVSSVSHRLMQSVKWRLQSGMERA